MLRSRCTAYGLVCESDFDWPWCGAEPSMSASQIRLHLGGLGRYEQYADTRRLLARRAADDAQAPPVVRFERGDDGHYRVAYADGAEFIIDPSLSEVYGVSRSELVFDDLLVYLQGPILGYLLRLRGVTCLHASAAVVHDRAIVVVGEAGMGKSTTAAAFAQLGLPVLTDDVVALADEGAAFRVQPGLPRVLLWPESVAALFGACDALPRIVDTWDKRYLDLNQPGYRFAAKATPLAAIYVLGERLPATSEPLISALSGAQALIELVANTYANDLIDAARRAQEFEVLGRLVNHVPIRRVQAPSDRGAVRRVCQAIIDDVAALRSR